MMQWLPAVNIVLGLIGFVWMLLRTSARWREYPTEIQKLLTLTLALFFGLLATSFDMFISTDTLLRSAVVISAVKVAALYVLWTTHTTKYRTGTRTVDGNPGADQNRDVP